MAFIAFSPAPAGPDVEPAPAPRSLPYVPFAVYGPPAPAVPPLLRAPANPSLSPQGLGLTPNQAGRGRSPPLTASLPASVTNHLEANQEYNEISSEWGVPYGALLKALELEQRRLLQQQRLVHQQRQQQRRLAGVSEEPLQEFNEISSDWGVPYGVLLKALESEKRRITRNRQQQQRQQAGVGEEPLQEFNEISSDWGVPYGALLKALQREEQRILGNLRQQRQRASVGGVIGEEPLQEFNEISSDWGVPASAWALTLQKQRELLAKQSNLLRQQQQVQQPEEPLQEFNEISSDWGFPSSLLANAARSGLVNINQQQRTPAQFAQQAVNSKAGLQPVRIAPQTTKSTGLQPAQITHQPAMWTGPRQPVQAARQPAQSTGPQQIQARKSTTPAQPPRVNLDINVEGRFVYSHLVDGYLFTGPHRDSPLSLANSPAVKLLGGSFSFVSPDGIPVNIRKIRYHNP
ncbi:uncharacterized protein LOC113205554 [Frankliniella occidentalis]|uniref:Uncharacterized protein LOC113205554 n=1 Tax=Frankliniella occidentalis TaxID=133901 RepID=A0A9C6WXW3_FRAOC|nr:uncharacterized protein LOC113205554 [Frankliniella occidentalis]